MDRGRDPQRQVNGLVPDEPIEQVAFELPVLFQDECMAVVHKPSGMLVHRGMGADRDELFLLQAVRDQLGKFVHPIHRLDRPTSGLVAFAFDPITTRELQKIWQDGRLTKTYHAIARGWMPESSGFRDEALDDPDSGVLQEAQTHWRELDRLEVPWTHGSHPTRRLGLVELEPVTGRFHQLRRHLTRMAHPIVGDTVHGCRHINHEVEAQLGWWRLLLFAHRLRFPHPHTGEMLCLEDAPERGVGPWWERLKGIAVGV